MSTTEARSDATTDVSVGKVDMKFETVVIPVTDVDRAKEFYEGLGWRLDADLGNDDLRVVQLTPPGSGCSIQFGKGLTSAAPGSAQGLLVVSDIEAAHDELIGDGVDASEVFHDASGGFNRFVPDARASGPDPERRSYASFAQFSDPDGNEWQLQEITNRIPGRVDPASTAPGSWRRAVCASPSSNASSWVASAPTGRASRPRPCSGRVKPHTRQTRRRQARRSTSWRRSRGVTSWSRTTRTPVPRSG